MQSRLTLPSMHSRLRTQVLLTGLAFILLVSLVTWWVVARSQNVLIEFEAIKLAEIVADQASAARSAYSNLAVSKLYEDGYGAAEHSENLEGHIPLPAQFLRELSRRSQAASDAVFSFRPVSKWNLAEDQGISDDFQRWAWAELEAQEVGKLEGPIDWKPVWRIEKQNGEQTLRYLRSDPAASQACVDCHNALEKRADVIARRVADGVPPGKQWRLNDLLGGIEINIPLDQAVTIARAQTRHGLFTVLAVTVIGLIGMVLLVFVDSARNRAMTLELAHQARHDSLTGLPNRLYLEMEMTQWIESGDEFTVMLLDLNNFKQINDTLGHEAGDGVLQESGRRIGVAIGESGFVARLGGDEFAVVLPGSAPSVARDVATKIATAIERAYEVEGYAVALGASIGIALSPQNGTQLSELLRCADVAMYLAKNAGIASSFYESTHDHNRVATLLMKNQLREAVAAGDIEAHFQPKYCVETGRMTGVEALARWRTAEEGYISPEVFVPMAENLGLIRELTATMLDQTLRACLGWRAAGFDLTVAVNLSPRCLQDMSIVELISDKLDTVGLAATTLIVEVTEGALMSDVEKAASVLQALQGIGVATSIDDYGTGYCSLSYLTSLPINELKLDRSFIDKMQLSEKDALVVKATLDLARSLNLRMVAEGVENAPTLDALSRMGCDVVQGYFLSRPLSFAELGKRLPYIYRCKPWAGVVAANESETGESPLDKAA